MVPVLQAVPVNSLDGGVPDGAVTLDPWDDAEADIHAEDEEVRLAVKDAVTGRFLLALLKKAERPFACSIVPEAVARAGGNRFRYKYQSRRRPGDPGVEKQAWVDRSKYKVMGEDELAGFEDVFLDRVALSGKNAAAFTAKYQGMTSPASQKNLLLAMDRVLREGDPATRAFRNASLIVNPPDSTKAYPANMQGNVSCYLDLFIEARKLFARHGWEKMLFPDLRAALSTHAAPGSLFDEYLRRCHAQEHVAAGLIWAGKTYDLLGREDQAKDCFRRAGAEHPDQIPLFESGLHFYEPWSVVNASGDAPEDSGAVTFVDDRPAGKKAVPVILFSVDEVFLRIYGIQMFNYAIALKKYHMHFHVVGEPASVRRSIEDAQKLIRDLYAFRCGNVPFVFPTFSFEAFPAYIRENTKRPFYACARFLRAEAVMRHFDADVYITDVDQCIQYSPDGYFNALLGHDVSFPFTYGVVALTTSRRFLAGNGYFRNNDRGHLFLSRFARYLTYVFRNSVRDSIWTVDQVALSRTFDAVAATVDSGNANVGNRPFFQDKVRRQFEQGVDDELIRSGNKSAVVEVDIGNGTMVKRPFFQDKVRQQFEQGVDEKRIRDGGGEPDPESPSPVVAVSDNPMESPAMEKKATPLPAKPAAPSTPSADGGSALSDAELALFLKQMDMNNAIAFDPILNTRISRKHTINCFMGLLQRLQPGVTLEIGAHDATFSCNAKKLLPAAEVVAIEASPSVYEHQKTLTDFAGLGVQYRNNAVSDTDGEVVFYEHAPGGSKAESKIGSLLHRNSGAGEEVRVKAVTGDALLEKHAKSDNACLWIDVEGAIEKVLKGLRKSLEARKIAALFIELETHTVWRDQWLDIDVLRFLLGYGYVPLLRDKFPSGSQYNMIFVHADLPRSMTEGLMADYLQQMRCFGNMLDSAFDIWNGFDLLGGKAFVIEGVKFVFSAKTATAVREVVHNLDGVGARLFVEMVPDTYSLRYAWKTDAEAATGVDLLLEDEEILAALRKSHPRLGVQVRKVRKKERMFAADVMFTLAAMKEHVDFLPEFIRKTLPFINR